MKNQFFIGILFTILVIYTADAQDDTESIPKSTAELFKELDELPAAIQMKSPDLFIVTDTLISLEERYKKAMDQKEKNLLKKKIAYAILMHGNSRVILTEGGWISEMDFREWILSARSDKKKVDGFITHKEEGVRFRFFFLIP